MATGGSVSRSPVSDTTEGTRETRRDPVTVVLGLIPIGVAMVVAVLGWGEIDDTVASPTTALGGEIVTALVVLVELGGAAVVARGLLFPLRPLPGDDSLLGGPSRRVASARSRWSERAAVVVAFGAALLVTGLVLPLALFAPGPACSMGPCVPPSPPLSLQLGLAVGGAAAIGAGVVLARTARRFAGPTVARNA